jgi:membrane protease YdiL (CAAX protease family)
MNTPGVFDHLLVLVIAGLLPLSAYLGGRSEGEPAVFDTRAKIALYWGNAGTQWILTGLVAWAWLAGGSSLAELGLRHGWPDAPGAVILAAVVALYSVDVWWKLRSPEERARTVRRWRRDTPFMPANGREVAHAGVMAVTAGFCEEVLYRGYVIAYLLYWFGSSPAGSAAAIGLPALIFGLSHRYQGWGGVARVVLMAVAFGWFQVHTNLLWPLIVVHVVVDLIGCAISPTLMRSPAGGVEGSCDSPT